VDYRLAPEAPHPAPLEDIYSVFVWLHANAEAAAALYARDRQGRNSPSSI
jgi:acetyl esterase/lipase